MGKDEETEVGGQRSEVRGQRFLLVASFKFQAETLIHIELAAPNPALAGLTLGILGTLAHFRHLFLCNRTSLKKCQLLLYDYQGCPLFIYDS